MGGALIFTGLLLFVCDGVRQGRKTERSATWLDALLVGMGQALATLPRCVPIRHDHHRRLLRGLRAAVRRAVFIPAEYPAVLGANILSIGDAVAAGINAAEVPMYLVGVVTAAVVGYPLHTAAEV